tara:strand:+ start:244 stop:471 length:228 start_codon:yes stop_codon:yes gene_type:complete
MMEGSVDASWTCGCGSLNAHWRTTCGGCEEREIMENKTPRKDLLKILKRLKKILRCYKMEVGVYNTQTVQKLKHH